VAVVVATSPSAEPVSSGDCASRPRIPLGHKVALVDIAAGAAIRRYGEVIGTAAVDIPAGGWVNERNMRAPVPPALSQLPIATRRPPPLEPLTGFTFEGYRNPDGSVGTRNLLAISMSVQCVAGVTEHVARRISAELLPRYPNVDGVVALRHNYGCGVAIDAPEADIPIRTLHNLVRNPNFGGAPLVIGLGCEKLSPHRLLCEDTPRDETLILSLQDANFRGFADMVDGIMQLAERRLQQLDKRNRETCPASSLVVGLQCGGSDAFSGITANPAVGVAADLIVRAGGSVLFSEVTEVRDAVHLLTPRAADRTVGEALLRELQWYDAYLARGRVDRGANLSPGNQRGGLSNIVEKAMGSVVKSGCSPIVDVLGPGQRVRRPGLSFAATPASDFVCGTLQLAAGMNVHVFTTGRGSPYGLAEVPVIKVASNSDLARRWQDLIDLDAGVIATGEATVEEVGWRLFRLILDVASGRTTVAADRLGLDNDLSLFNPAPIT
jgi:galactarate dehydratase